MVPNPVVSIVCTVYNKELWLEQTIQSFLAQRTDFSYEILLIDDASTDSSADIMRRYQELYPDLIRTFYNDENQGIAKTWVSICKETRGKYIARCDGDDFWLDPEKLQKQVQFLNSHPTAKWSNTDFDVYNEKGEFVSAAGFENGLIPLADTFEKMLATRGFTMASTWLVERELMLEVNEELDLTTSDDTFNLQMDLFQRTDLAYLPEVTVAYVINQGSDSRPKDFAQIEKRFNALLETQKDYLEKYPHSNYHEMLGILLERNNHYELELTKQSAGLEKIGQEKVTIYFDRGGQGFHQDESICYPLGKRDRIAISIPSDCRKIRIDLSESPSFYQKVCLTSLHSQTELLPDFTNGIILGERYIFPNSDPQLVYQVSTDLFGKDFVLEYILFNINNLYSDDYIGKTLAQDLLDEQRKNAHLYEYKFRYLEALQMLERQRKDAEEVTRLYNAVTHSRRWTIPTKIINFFRRKK